jgi:hypothetical protein
MAKWITLAVLGVIFIALVIYDTAKKIKEEKNK